MQIDTFIQLVEKLANVSSIYVDDNAPQNAYDVEYNKRIADAFRQAKIVVQVCTDAPQMFKRKFKQ